MIETLGLLSVVALGLLSAAAPRRQVGAAVMAFVVGLLCLARLGWAFLAEQWEFAYVADHTRPGLRWPLRLAGLWAGPEGSLLFWTVLVSGVSAVVVWRSAAEHRASAARLTGGLTAAYALVVVVAASPFDRPDLPPVSGLGLQPILEHPAMTWHPPLLYLGLVAMLYPAIRTAASGAPARVRAWLIPLGILAIGLATGSRWAHAEVGWGGYWAWDPIENAGLAVFLAGTAALHGSMARSASNRWGASAVWLGVLPGVAALWATTITRIGVIESVHAFADRPALRLGLIGVATLGTVGFGTTAFGATSLRATALPASARAAVTTPKGLPGVWFGAAVLSLATLYVAFGTYEPVVEAATTGDRLAIAGRYYTRLLWPLAVLGAGAATLLVTKGRSPWSWLGPLGGAAAALALTPLASGPFAMVLAVLGGALVGSTATGPQRGRVAHAGMGILLVGIAGTMATERATVTLAVGEERHVIGLDLTHLGLGLDPPTDSGSSSATSRLEVDGVVEEPRLVRFTARGSSTAEVAHRFRGLDEVQVILIDGDENAASYRVHRIPRVALVWLGSALIAGGMLLSAIVHTLKPMVTGPGSR